MGKAVINSNQVSITEWFAQIGEIDQANEFRKEDNDKAERLETLYQEIGLIYERPEKFSARDLADKSPNFAQVLSGRGNELCAIRLVPIKEGLPKLRNRGVTINECYNDWFLKQDINPDDYDAYVCPHSETLLWSATFVVNDEMIFGEIVEGMHSQLTHGDTEHKLYHFRYDYKEWQWSEKNEKAAVQVEKMISMIIVEDPQKQDTLIKLLNAKFCHNYIAGYFECTVWPDGMVRFIDYNRVLPKYISSPPGFAFENLESELTGIPASGGKACGVVCIVDELTVENIDFPEGAVLVCKNTDVRYLPYMKKSSAIVTELGGILSHAAIISRELKKPCIIGVSGATTVLKNSSTIEVDANSGVVRNTAA